MAARTDRLADGGVSRQQSPAAPQAEQPTPAQIKQSITPDALISFIAGKPYKTLKRHLGRRGLTIDAYRERFGLPEDYPAVAASYSRARSALARNLGLGGPRKEATIEGRCRRRDRGRGAEGRRGAFEAHQGPEAEEG